MNGTASVTLTSHLRAAAYGYQAQQ